MASDIVFRVATENPEISGSIGLSNYTEVIKEDTPKNVLLLNGEWEPRLRAKSLQILKSIGVNNPLENNLYGSIDNGTARKVITIENANHVGILYSKNTQKEVIKWFHEIRNNDGKVVTHNIGWWVLILFISFFFIFVALTFYIPRREGEKTDIRYFRIFAGNILALITVPMTLNYMSFNFSLYTAHNHLINHLLLYSIILGMSVFYDLKSVKSFFLKSFNL